jgi:hypothetical protein
MPNSSERSRRSAAGAGLGRDIALGLAAKGYIVFGTAMSAAEIQERHVLKGRR